MKITDHIDNATVFLSLTSLTKIEYEYLLAYFSPEWEKYYRYHTLEGKKRIIVSYKEHKNSVLQGTEQKLFFMLSYMKNNNLQTFHGATFGISQSKVSKIYRVLLSVLDTTLKKMNLSPCRNGEDLKSNLSSHKCKVFWYDGTETPIQRNDDEAAQEIEYSGKKRGHRLKNLVLCDVFQEILYLSPTEEGSIHDKAIANAYPIILPENSVIKQDLGFVGHEPAGVMVEQPFKKPKNAELSFGKKIYNKIFSATRIVSEHANSGFKRLRMMKDVLRIHDFGVRDMLRTVACALHNLRVRAIDKTRLYQTSDRTREYIQLFSE